MQRRIALLSVVFATIVLLNGCSRSPSGPGVGANVDPRAKADELAALAGTWVYERQIVEGKEIPAARQQGGVQPTLCRAVTLQPDLV